MCVLWRLSVPRIHTSLPSGPSQKLLLEVQVGRGKHFLPPLLFNHRLEIPALMVLFGHSPLRLPSSLAVLVDLIYKVWQGEVLYHCVLRVVSHG